MVKKGVIRVVISTDGVSQICVSMRTDCEIAGPEGLTTVRAVLFNNPSTIGFYGCFLATR